MTTTAAPPSTGAEHGRLADGALGLPSVLFCIVTGAAPLAAMVFNVPIAVIGGGYAAPAAFLIATVVADGLLGRLHRDEPPRDLRRRLLHVHQPRARAGRRRRLRAPHRALLHRLLRRRHRRHRLLRRHQLDAWTGSTCPPGSTWLSAWRS